MAGGVLAAPLAAEAQQAGKKYRVGVVLEGGPFYRAAQAPTRGTRSWRQFADVIADVVEAESLDLSPQQVQDAAEQAAMIRAQRL